MLLRFFKIALGLSNFGNSGNFKSYKYLNSYFTCTWCLSDLVDQQ